MKVTWIKPELKVADFSAIMGCACTCSAGTGAGAGHGFR